MDGWMYGSMGEKLYGLHLKMKGGVPEYIALFSLHLCKKRKFYVFLPDSRIKTRKCKQSCFDGKGNTGHQRGDCNFHTLLDNRCE